FRRGLQRCGYPAWSIPEGRCIERAASTKSIRPRPFDRLGRISLPAFTLFAMTTTTDTASGRETLGFQAEVKQLLQLMIHSLYSNREIFLRELVSNASDACDRLRFEALDHPELFAGDPDLRIRVAFDKPARTITVSDNGIGMSRDEVIANL